MNTFRPNIDKTVANVHLLYPRLQEYITVSDVVTGIGVITLVYYPSLVFLAWFKMTNLSISASRYGISLRGNLSDAKKRKGNHEMANCEFVDRIIAKKMVRFVGDSNPGLSGSLLDMTAPYTNHLSVDVVREWTRFGRQRTHTNESSLKAY